MKEISDITFLEPTVQILSIKKISSASTGHPERYRFILSDGLTYTQSMLSTNLNSKAEDSTFRKNAIVKLTKFDIQQIKASR